MDTEKNQPVSATAEIELLRDFLAMCRDDATLRSRFTSLQFQVRINLVNRLEDASATPEAAWEKFDDDLEGHSAPVTDPEELRRITEALKPAASTAASAGEAEFESVWLKVTDRHVVSKVAARAIWDAARARHATPAASAGEAVTDTMTQAGYFAEQKHEEDCGENWDRATWQVRIRKIIEAAWRARPAAPVIPIISHQIGDEHKVTGPTAANAGEVVTDALPPLPDEPIGYVWYLNDGEREFTEDDVCPVEQDQWATASALYDADQLRAYALSTRPAAPVIAPGEAVAFGYVSAEEAQWLPGANYRQCVLRSYRDYASDVPLYLSPPPSTGSDDTESERMRDFQGRVAPWMQECFGPVISADRVERSDRFIEESLELVQACGYAKERAHALVEYVYGRPIGEPVQECGGVMVTLAALCLAHGFDMHEAAETELQRISAPEIIAKIRAKQASKPTGSALPIATGSDGQDAKRFPDEPTQEMLWAMTRARYGYEHGGSAGSYDALMYFDGSIRPTAPGPDPACRQEYFALVAAMAQLTARAGEVTK